jgi:hypothetical protein
MRGAEESELVESWSFGVLVLYSPFLFFPHIFSSTHTLGLGNTFKLEISVYENPLSKNY